MGIWGIYAESLANWLSGGSLVLRENLSSLSIKPSYDRYMTKKRNTRVWIIRGLPVNLKNNISHMIRTGMHEKFPEVETNLQYINKPTDPQVTREVFKRQLARSEEAFSKYKSVYDSLSDSEKLMGKTQNLGGGLKFTVKQKDMLKRKATYDSYSYVFKHRAGNDSSGEFFRTHIFIQAFCDDMDQLDKFRKELNLMLEGQDIFSTEVKGNVSKYLANFGPASYDREETKYFTSNLMSDENLAALSPTKTHGLVGGRGTLMGLDVLSRLPLILDYHKTSAAQVSLFIGTSGYGKTFAAMLKIVSLISQDHHCTIVDLKGGEWTKLRFFTEVLNIDLDGPNARFVNTLRLDDLDIDPSDASYMFEMSVKATVGLFSLMTSLDPEVDGATETDLETLLDIAVRKTYDQISGFNSEKVKTFGKTADMKLTDIMDNLEGLSTVKSFNEGMIKLVPIVLARCSMYLRSRGHKSEMFRNEITLGEVLYSKTVVFSLNKNTDPEMTLMDDMKVFMIGHLANKKNYVRRKKGLHTAMVFEEVQRTEENDTMVITKKRGASAQLLRYISHTVTGSRSDNVMVMILLNSISTFNNPATRAIRSNITTIVAGKMNPLDIDILANDFGAHSIKDYLKQLEKGETKFKNTFAIKFDNGHDNLSTMYKVIVPDAFEKELRQRDVVDEEITEIEATTI